MALADDIRSLQTRTAAELATAHDYYVHAKIAWEMVRQRVAAGGDFTAHNLATGSRVSATELAGLARGYVTVQLGEATFIRFVSIFETFLFDLLRLWLVAHPRTLLGKQVDFQTVLDATDVSDIVRLVADRELNELTYKRPAEWFRYLNDRIKLGCPSPAEIDAFAEAKATRDVLVHNRGLVGRMYLTKSGPLARYAEGERMDIPEPYHLQTWELVRKMADDLAAGAAAKA